MAAEGLTVQCGVHGILITDMSVGLSKRRILVDCDML